MLDVFREHMREEYPPGTRVTPRGEPEHRATITEWNADLSLVRIVWDDLSVGEEWWEELRWTKTIPRGWFSVGFTWRFEKLTLLDKLSELLGGSDTESIPDS